MGCSEDAGLVPCSMLEVPIGVPPCVLARNALELFTYATETCNPEWLSFDEGLRIGLLAASMSDDVECLQVKKNICQIIIFLTVYNN